MVAIGKKKKTHRRVDFAVPADNWVNIKENEKINKFLVLELEKTKQKTVEHKGNGDTNCNWYTWNGHKRLEKLEIRGRIKTIMTTALT